MIKVFSRFVVFLKIHARSFRHYAIDEIELLICRLDSHKIEKIENGYEHAFLKFRTGFPVSFAVQVELRLVLIIINLIVSCLSHYELVNKII